MGIPRITPVFPQGSGSNAPVRVPSMGRRVLRCVFGPFFAIAGAWVLFHTVPQVLQELFQDLGTCRQAGNILAIMLGFVLFGPF